MKNSKNKRSAVIKTDAAACFRTGEHLKTAEIPESEGGTGIIIVDHFYTPSGKRPLRTCVLCVSVYKNIIQYVIGFFNELYYLIQKIYFYVHSLLYIIILHSGADYDTIVYIQKSDVPVKAH